MCEPKECLLMEVKSEDDYMGSARDKIRGKS